MAMERMLDEGVCLRVFLENGATLGSGEIEDVRKRTKSAVWEEPPDNDPIYDMFFALFKDDTLAL